MSKRMYHPCHKLSVPSAKLFWCRHCMQMFEDAITRWKHSKQCRGSVGYKPKDQDGQVVQMYVKPDKVCYTTNLVPGQGVVHKPHVKKTSADLKCVICHAKFMCLDDMREHVKYPCQRYQVESDSEESDTDSKPSTLKIRRVDSLDTTTNTSTALAVLAEASKHVESLAHKGSHISPREVILGDGSVEVTPIYPHYQNIDVLTGQVIEQQEVVLTSPRPFIRQDLEPVVVFIQSEDGQDLPESSLDLNTIQNCVKDTISTLPLGQIIQVEINIKEKKTKYFAVGCKNTICPIQESDLQQPHVVEIKIDALSPNAGLKTDVRSRSGNSLQPTLHETIDADLVEALSGSLQAVQGTNTVNIKQELPESGIYNPTNIVVEEIHSIIENKSEFSKRQSSAEHSYQSNQAPLRLKENTEHVLQVPSQVNQAQHTTFQNRSIPGIPQSSVLGVNQNSKVNFGTLPIVNSVENSLNKSRVNINDRLTNQLSYLQSLSSGVPVNLNNRIQKKLRFLVRSLTNSQRNPNRKSGCLGKLGTFIMASGEQLGAVEDWFGFAELTDDTSSVVKTQNPQASTSSQPSTLPGQQKNVLDQQNQSLTPKNGKDLNEVVVPTVSDKSGKIKYKVLARQKAEDEVVDKEKDSAKNYPRTTFYVRNNFWKGPRDMIKTIQPQQTRPVTYISDILKAEREREKKKAEALQAEKNKKLEVSEPPDSVDVKSVSSSADSKETAKDTVDDKRIEKDKQKTEKKKLKKDKDKCEEKVKRKSKSLENHVKVTADVDKKKGKAKASENEKKPKRPKVKEKRAEKKEKKVGEHKKTHSKDPDERAPEGALSSGSVQSIETDPSGVGDALDETKITSSVASDTTVCDINSTSCDTSLDVVVDKSDKLVSEEVPEPLTDLKASDFSLEKDMCIEKTEADQVLIPDKKECEQLNDSSMLACPSVSNSETSACTESQQDNPSPNKLELNHDQSIENQLDVKENDCDEHKYEGNIVEPMEATTTTESEQDNISEKDSPLQRRHSSDVIDHTTQSVHRQISLDDSKLKVPMVYNPESSVGLRKSGRLKSAKCSSRYRGDYGIRTETYTKLLHSTSRSAVDGKTSEEEIDSKDINTEICSGDRQSNYDETSSSSGESVNKRKKGDTDDNETIHKKVKADTDTDRLSGVEDSGISDVSEQTSESGNVNLECDESTQNMDVEVKCDSCDNKISKEEKINACGIEHSCSEEITKCTKSFNTCKFVLEQKNQHGYDSVHLDLKPITGQDSSENHPKSWNSDTGVPLQCAASQQGDAVDNSESIADCVTCQSSSDRHHQLSEKHQCDTQEQVPCSSEIPCICDKTLTNCNLTHKPPIQIVVPKCHSCPTCLRLQTGDVPECLLRSGQHSQYVHSVGKSVNKKQNQLSERRNKSNDVNVNSTESVVIDSSPESSPTKGDPVTILEDLRMKLFEKAGAAVKTDNEPKQFECKLISSKRKESQNVKVPGTAADEKEQSNCATECKSGRSTPRSTTPKSVSETNIEILHEVAQSLDIIKQAKRKAEQQTGEKIKPKRQRFAQKKFMLRSMVHKNEVQPFQSNQTLTAVKEDNNSDLKPDNDTCSIQTEIKLDKLDDISGIEQSETEKNSDQVHIVQTPNSDGEKSSQASSSKTLQEKGENMETDHKEVSDAKPEPKVKKDTKLKPKLIKCQACNHSFRNKDLMRKHYPCRIRQTRTWSQNVLRPKRAFRKPDKKEEKFKCSLPKSMKTDSKSRPQLLTTRKTKFRRVKGKRRRKLYQLLHDLREKRKIVHWPHLSVSYENLTYKEQCMYKIGLFCTGDSSAGSENYTHIEMAWFEKHREIQKKIDSEKFKLTATDSESDSMNMTADSTDKVETDSENADTSLNDEQSQTEQTSSQIEKVVSYKAKTDSTQNLSSEEGLSDNIEKSVGSLVDVPVSSKTEPVAFQTNETPINKPSGENDMSTEVLNIDQNDFEEKLKSCSSQSEEISSKMSCSEQVQKTVTEEHIPPYETVHKMELAAISQSEMVVSNKVNNLDILSQDIQTLDIHSHEIPVNLSQELDDRPECTQSPVLDTEIIEENPIETSIIPDHMIDSAENITEIGPNKFPDIAYIIDGLIDRVLISTEQTAEVNIAQKHAHEKCFTNNQETFTATPLENTFAKPIISGDQTNNQDIEYPVEDKMLVGNSEDYSTEYHSAEHSLPLICSDDHIEEKCLNDLTDLDKNSLEKIESDSTEEKSDEILNNLDEVTTDSKENCNSSLNEGISEILTETSSIVEHDTAISTNEDCNSILQTEDNDVAYGQETIECDEGTQECSTKCHSIEDDMASNLDRDKRSPEVIGNKESYTVEANQETDDLNIQTITPDNEENISQDAEASIIDSDNCVPNTEKINISEEASCNDECLSEVSDSHHNQENSNSASSENQQNIEYVEACPVFQDENGNIDDHSEHGDFATNQEGQKELYEQDMEEITVEYSEIDHFNGVEEVIIDSNLEAQTELTAVTIDTGLTVPQSDEVLTDNSNEGTINVLEEKETVHELNIDNSNCEENDKQIAYSSPNMDVLDNSNKESEAVRSNSMTHDLVENEDTCVEQVEIEESNHVHDNLHEPSVANDTMVNEQKIDNTSELNECNESVSSISEMADLEPPTPDTTLPSSQDSSANDTSLDLDNSKDIETDVSTADSNDTNIVKENFTSSTPKLNRTNINSDVSLDETEIENKSQDRSSDDEATICYEIDGVMIRENLVTGVKTVIRNKSLIPSSEESEDNSPIKASLATKDENELNTSSVSDNILESSVEDNSFEMSAEISDDDICGETCNDTEEDAAENKHDKIVEKSVSIIQYERNGILISENLLTGEKTVIENDKSSKSFLEDVQKSGDELRVETCKEDICGPEVVCSENLAFPISCQDTITEDGSKESVGQNHDVKLNTGMETENDVISVNPYVGENTNKDEIAASPVSEPMTNQWAPCYDTENVNHNADLVTKFKEQKSVVLKENTEFTNVSETEPEMCVNNTSIISENNEETTDETPQNDSDRSDLQPPQLSNTEDCLSDEENFDVRPKSLEKKSSVQYKKRISNESLNLEKEILRSSPVVLLKRIEDMDLKNISIMDMPKYSNESSTDNESEESFDLKPSSPTEACSLMGNLSPSPAEDCAQIGCLSPSPEEVCSEMGDLEIPPILEKVDEECYFEKLNESTVVSEDSQSSGYEPPTLFPEEEAPASLQIAGVMKDSSLEDMELKQDKESKKPRTERHFLDVLGVVEEQNSSQSNQLGSLDKQPLTLNNQTKDEEFIGRHFSDIVDTSMSSDKSKQSRLGHFIQSPERRDFTLAEIKKILKPKNENLFSKESLLKLRSDVASLLKNVKTPVKKDPAWLKRDSLTAYRRKKSRSTKVQDSVSDKLSLSDSDLNLDNQEQSQSYEEFTDDESESSDWEFRTSTEDEKTPVKETENVEGKGKEDDTNITKGGITENILQMLTSFEDKGNVAVNMSNLLEVLAKNLGFSAQNSDIPISSASHIFSDSESDYSDNEMEPRQGMGEEQQQQYQLNEFDEENEPPCIDDIPLPPDSDEEESQMQEHDSAIPDESHKVEPNKSFVEKSISQGLDNVLDIQEKEYKEQHSILKEKTDIQAPYDVSLCQEQTHEENDLSDYSSCKKLGTQSNVDLSTDVCNDSNDQTSEGFVNETNIEPFERNENVISHKPTSSLPSSALYEEDSVSNLEEFGAKPVLLSSPEHVYDEHQMDNTSTEKIISDNEQSNLDKPINLGNQSSKWVNELTKDKNVKQSDDSTIFKSITELNSILTDSDDSNHADSYDAVSISQRMFELKALSDNNSDVSDLSDVENTDEIKSSKESHSCIKTDTRFKDSVTDDEIDVNREMSTETSTATICQESHDNCQNSKTNAATSDLTMQDSQSFDHSDIVQNQVESNEDKDSQESLKVTCTLDRASPCQLLSEVPQLEMKDNSSVLIQKLKGQEQTSLDNNLHANTADTDDHRTCRNDFERQSYGEAPSLNTDLEEDCKNQDTPVVKELYYNESIELSKVNNLHDNDNSEECQTSLNEGTDQNIEQHVKTPEPQSSVCDENEEIGYECKNEALILEKEINTKETSEITDDQCEPNASKPENEIVSSGCSMEGNKGNSNDDLIDDIKNYENGKCIPESEQEIGQDEKSYISEHTINDVNDISNNNKNNRLNASQNTEEQEIATEEVTTDKFFEAEDVGADDASIVSEGICTAVEDCKTGLFESPGELDNDCSYVIDEDYTIEVNEDTDEEDMVLTDIETKTGYEIENGTPKACHDLDREDYAIEVNKDIDNEDTDDEDTVNKDNDNEDAENEGTDNKDIESKDLDTEDTDNEDTVNKDIDNEYTDNEETGNEDTDKRDIDNEDAEIEDTDDRAIDNEVTDNEDTVVKDIDNEDTDNEDTVNKNIDNKDTDNEDTDNEKTDKNDINNEETVIKDKDNKVTDNDDAVKNDTDAKDTGNEDADRSDINNEDTVNMNIDNKDIGTEDTDNEDTGKKDIGNKNTDNEDTDNEDAVINDTDNEDAVINDTDNEDAVINDTDDKDTDDKDTDNEDTDNEDTDNEDAVIKDTDNEDAVINDTDNEDAVINDTDNEDAVINDTDDKDTDDKDTDNEDTDNEDTDNEKLLETETTSEVDCERVDISFACDDAKSDNSSAVKNEDGYDDTLQNEINIVTNKEMSIGEAQSLPNSIEMAHKENEVECDLLPCILEDPCIETECVTVETECVTVETEPFDIDSEEKSEIVSKEKSEIVIKDTIQIEQLKNGYTATHLEIQDENSSNSINTPYDESINGNSNSTQNYNDLEDNSEGPLDFSELSKDILLSSHTTEGGPTVSEKENVPIEECPETLQHDYMFFETIAEKVKRKQRERLQRQSLNVPSRVVSLTRKNPAVREISIFRSSMLDRRIRQNSLSSVNIKLPSKKRKHRSNSVPKEMKLSSILRIGNFKIKPCSVKLNKLKPSTIQRYIRRGVCKSPARSIDRPPIKLRIKLSDIIMPCSPYSPYTESSTEDDVEDNPFFSPDKHVEEKTSVKRSGHSTAVTETTTRAKSVDNISPQLTPLKLNMKQLMMSKSKSCDFKCESPRNPNTDPSDMNTLLAKQICCTDLQLSESDSDEDEDSDNDSKVKSLTSKPIKDSNSHNLNSHSLSTKVKAVDKDHTSTFNPVLQLSNDSSSHTKTVYSPGETQSTDCVSPGENKQSVNALAGNSLASWTQIKFVQDQDIEECEDETTDKLISDNQNDEELNQIFQVAGSLPTFSSDPQLSTSVHNPIDSTLPALTNHSVDNKTDVTFKAGLPDLCTNSDILTTSDINSDKYEEAEKAVLILESEKFKNDIPAETIEPGFYRYAHEIANVETFEAVQALETVEFSEISARAATVINTERVAHNMSAVNYMDANSVSHSVLNCEAVVDEQTNKYIYGISDDFQGSADVLEEQVIEETVTEPSLDDRALQSAQISANTNLSHAVFPLDRDSNL